MRAPAFWDRPPGLAAASLQPVAALYGAVAARRLRRDGAVAPVPVLCVGDLTVGGAGKTPAALGLARLLREDGWSPAFLSRGYRGRLAGPVRVDVGRHGHEDVGDEPLLLAREGLAVVARDRPAGARLAAVGGADVVVMDDGLQNPSLRKDLAVAVVDGAGGIGNGLVVPAGPLRAPLAAQWPRVDVALILGEGPAGDAVARAAAALGRPVLRGRLEPDAAAASRLRGRRVLAFAGIGRPAKLFDALARLGAAVVETAPFPDHHAYRPGEVDALLARARTAGLTLVTTEKDAVRLPGPARAAAIETLPVRLALDDVEAARRLLRERLPRPPRLSEAAAGPAVPTVGAPPPARRTPPAAPRSST